MANPTYSETTYPGGKAGSGTYQKLINLIPAHSIYVSPFCGYDGVFRNKRLSRWSVLNDINADVINQWKKNKSWRRHANVCLDFFQPDMFNDATTPTVILRNHDYKPLIERYAHNAEAFIFLDPPYPMDTRKQQRSLYVDDWHDDLKHVEFLELAKSISAPTMICSYPNELYNEYLKEWHSLEYQSNTRNGMRTEIVYMNYERPLFIHDTRFLGANYRDRWEIKKKTKRHIDRLDSLPHEQRVAILSAIVNQHRDTLAKLVTI